MPYRTPWTNFTSGEWTPQLLGRYDIKKYFNSVRLLENFYSKPYGGISKVPGSVFVFEQKDETRKARVVPFKYSKVLIYTLEFEGGREVTGTEVGGYLRFFANNGVVVSSGTTPYELESPYKEIDLPEIHYAQIKDKMYLVHPDYPVYRLERSDHADWTLAQVEFRHGPFGPKNQYKDWFIGFDNRVGSVNLTASFNFFSADHIGETIRLLDGEVLIDTVTDGYTATGTVIEQIKDGRHLEAYGEETLDSTWTVNSGTMTTNTNVEVEGTDAWEIKKNFDLYYDRKYFFGFTPTGDLTGPVNLTFTLSTNDYNPVSGNLIGGDHIREVFTGTFSATEAQYFELDMGEYLGGQLDFNATENTWPPDPDKVQLTFTIAFNGTATDTAGLERMTFRDIKPGHPAATHDWAECAFSARRGYAQRVGFFDGRMLLAATPSLPNALWMSVSSGDMEDFDAWDAELDTTGIFVQLEADMLEEIQWLKTKKDIWAGTDQGVWRITSADSGAPIAPASVKAVPEATFGAHDADALSIENVIMYASRSAEKVREIAYSLEEDNWKSVEVSLFGEHLFKESPLADWAWQQQPYGFLWCIREDGMLCGMTYMREQDVLSWWRCPKDNVEVESICSITEEDGYDQVWMTVKRTVDGVERRYVEYIDREYFDQEDWHYADSGLKYDGTPIGTVGGLEHLEGELVSILSDGAVCKQQRVDANGEVPLVGDDGPVTGSKIHVGLAYTSSLRTQNIEQTQPTGTIQGLHLRMQRIVAKLYATGYGLQFATDEDGPWEPVDVRYLDAPMDTPPIPYTGDAEVYIQTDYDPDSSIWLRHSEPTQCNVLSLVAEWEEGE